MDTELFKTKFNKQESEYLNQYFDYVSPEIDKALTEEEKINLFKIFVIKYSSYGYKTMGEGMREVVFAIEDLARGEDKTSKTSYRTKEHFAYAIADALLKTKGQHYYFVDLMMKLAKIIGIEDSLIDEQKDFIHLRNTNYPEFCKKYCPEFNKEDKEEVKQTEVKQTEVKQTEVTEVHNPVAPQVEGHCQEKVSVVSAEKSPDKTITKRKLFDFAKSEQEQKAEIPEVRKIALENLKAQTQQICTQQICPDCKGNLIPLKDKDSKHFAICDKCKNGYNTNYNPPKIYYKEKKKEKEKPKEKEEKNWLDFRDREKDENGIIKLTDEEILDIPLTTLRCWKFCKTGTDWGLNDNGESDYCCGNKCNYHELCHGNKKTPLEKRHDKLKPDKSKLESYK